MKKKYIDCEDGARILGCHPETLRLMVRKGLLKPIDPDPPYVFDRRIIEALPRPHVGRPRKIQAGKVR